jgi:hypothetical protein
VVYARAVGDTHTRQEVEAGGLHPNFSFGSDKRDVANVTRLAPKPRGAVLLSCPARDRCGHHHLVRDGDLDVAVFDAVDIGHVNMRDVPHDSLSV